LGHLKAPHHQSVQFTEDIPIYIEEGYSILEQAGL
jgi:hypothetical protein